MAVKGPGPPNVLNVCIVTDEHKLLKIYSDSHECFDFEAVI